jgi:2-polyprenyl-6-methoxyphenol hydroxylase-like FAD-dependent oxidoreductase
MREQSTAESEPQVVIVGAGPVGATLALELAHHAVPSALVERLAWMSPYPKMDYLNGRTMEHMRRIGLVGDIRQHGIPTDHRFNFRWATSLDSPPIAIWDYPSVDETSQQLAGVNDGTAMLEPYHRVPGSMFEEVLRRRARSHPLVTMYEGWRFTELDDSRDEASVRIVCERTGEERTLRARYVVGCDGAGSSVRDQSGIGVDAEAPATRHCDVYFRCADPALTRYGLFFLTIFTHGITLVSRNGQDVWTATFQLPEGPAPERPASIVEERLGITIDDVYNVAFWQGRLGIAQVYRQSSIFLAGDAAHQFYPTGGYGANTGIGDAVDLGWKLAARLKDWGGERLLDSYESERRPVALFNRAMSARLLEVWRRFPRLAAESIPRERITGYLQEEASQIDNAGVEFDIRHAGSPVICHEPGPPPPWSWREIAATTWPGNRAPSMRLPDGSALFDHFGTELTLVDMTEDGIGGPLARHAHTRGIPMTHLEVRSADVRRVWQRDLVLVRPDQHVAWRGDRPPADWDVLLDHVTGW